MQEDRERGDGHVKADTRVGSVSDLARSRLALVGARGESVAACNLVAQRFDFGIVEGLAEAPLLEHGGYPFAVVLGAERSAGS